MFSLGKTKVCSPTMGTPANWRHKTAKDKKASQMVSGRDQLLPSEDQFVKKTK